MDLSKLFIGELTEEQAAALRAFQHAVEALGPVICYGDLVITFHQNAPTEFKLSRTFRPQAATAPPRRT